MGYDRIWIQSTEHPQGLLDGREAAKRNLSDDFNGICNRLFAQGHFVELVAGKNHLFEEIFLFEDAASGQLFYERDFRKWESFIEDGAEGCGFQRVSLYRNGHLVATKACEPSASTELDLAETDYSFASKLQS